MHSDDSRDVVPAASPHWVLLRGLVREAGHWDDFLPVFAQAVAPRAMHTVVAPDLPGNGTRHAERSPATVPALMESVRERLRQGGVPPPYRLLGLSLGAMLCVDWARKHPHEVAGAVLVNTSLRPFSAFHERLQPRAWPLLARAMRPGQRDEDIERAVLALTSRDDFDGAARERIVAHWVELRRRHPVSRANALRQLLAAARYRAPQTPPPAPLLVVGTRGDRLVSPRCSVALARNWGTDFVQHPDAGHDLPLDDPRWLAEVVQAWAA
ncbi:MAG: alpha/beta hydrolase [Burkholderiales bacterium]|nr:alpha/beta hydrolase [Burkholderiales bacterium]